VKEEKPGHFRTAVTMWGLLAFFSFFQFFIQASGSLMGSAWQHAFRLNDFELSILSSSFFYAYMIVQVFAGFLYDHWGARRVVHLAAIVFTAALFLFSWTHSFWLAVFARFLMGCGSGFAFVGMVYISALWFLPRQFILFVGLGEMLSMFLTSVGQGITSPLIQNFGWRVVLVGLGLFGVIYIILVNLFLKNPQNFKPKVQPFLKTLWSHLKEVVKIKQVWLAGFFGAAAFGVITVFVSLWGSIFLQKAYGFTYINATDLVALVPFGFAIGASVFGFINQRYLSTTMLACISGAVLLALYLGLLFFGHNLLINFGLYIGFGFFGGVSVLSYYIVERSVTAELRGIALPLGFVMH